ncbi:FAD-dependent oxidoreductase [Geodermatophilus sp. SYSU D00766]
MADRTAGVVVVGAGIVGSPALLVRLTAPPGLVRTLVVTPRLEVRQAAGGDLLVARVVDGGTTREDLRRAGEEARERIAATSTGADGVRPAGVRVGTRPVPADGSPVIGPLPGVAGVHLAVLHSAVTLAPVVGRLVAAEVVSGVDAVELRALRPGPLPRLSQMTHPVRGRRHGPSSGPVPGAGRSPRESGASRVPGATGAESNDRCPAPRRSPGSSCVRRSRRRPP